METSKIILGYFIYLPIALVLTYYVAKTLFKNSTVFMIEIFKGKEEIANATNTLFKVGFYLLNIGFALLILKINAHEINETYQSLIEILSKKIGGFSIYLGFMLFLNMFLFFRGRKKSKTMQVPTNLVVKN
jgi:H+/gluconate symporter-like permease